MGMTVANRKNGEDTTISGVKRVRFERGVGHRKAPRDMTKLNEARDRSYAEAPRAGRGKGKIVPGYSYKRLLEIHAESEYVNPPRVRKIEHDPVENKRIPLFMRHPEVADKIVDLIEQGVPYTTVCGALGISPDQFKKWLKIGKTGTNPHYTDFYHKIAKAEANAEILLLNELKRIGGEDWKSRAWTLERRWPEHWARRDRIEAEIGLKHDITVTKKEELAEKILRDPDALGLARKLIEGEEFGYQVVNDATELEEDQDGDAEPSPV